MGFSKADKVCVIVPCFRVTKQILQVLDAIPNEIVRIYVVDDACPEKTGDLVQKNIKDKRVTVLRNEKNLGVGGAVKAGYSAAISDGMNILIKIDGDGQMDPKLIPLFVKPIKSGTADYTKGNRFYDLEALRQMPKERIFGNIALSFFSKFSTGYWDIYDPTNGYTAINAAVADKIPLNKLSNGYFFETDILFRLNTLRGVVVDIPMTARYQDEKSNLKIRQVLFEFAFKHMVLLQKRIFYNYFLRNFSIATLQLFVGFSLFLFGIVFGALSWHQSYLNGFTSSTGTVMLAVLPIIVGLQFLLSFLSYDMNSMPTKPLHTNLELSRKENKG